MAIAVEVLVVQAVKLADMHKPCPELGIDVWDVPDYCPFHGCYPWDNPCRCYADDSEGDSYE